MKKLISSLALTRLPFNALITSAQANTDSVSGTILEDTNGTSFISRQFQYLTAIWLFSSLY